MSKYIAAIELATIRSGAPLAFALAREARALATKRTHGLRGGCNAQDDPDYRRRCIFDGCSRRDADES
jgi:hypothetical protein